MQANNKYKSVYVTCCEDLWSCYTETRFGLPPFGSYNALISLSVTAVLASHSRSFTALKKSSRPKTQVCGSEGERPFRSTRPRRESRERRGVAARLARAARQPARPSRLLTAEPPPVGHCAETRSTELGGWRTLTVSRTLATALRLGRGVRAALCPVACSGVRRAEPSAEERQRGRHTAAFGHTSPASPGN